VSLTLRYTAVFVPTGSGATTHATSGALTGQGSAVAGTAQHNARHTTTGIVVGSGSVVAGVAQHKVKHSTTGAIQGAGSIITGVATRKTIHTCTGVLHGSGAIIVGACLHLGPWTIVVKSDTASEIVMEAIGFVSPSGTLSGTMFDPTAYRAAHYPYQYLPIKQVTYSLASGLAATLYWQSGFGNVPVIDVTGSGNVLQGSLEAYEDCGPLKIVFAWQHPVAKNYVLTVDVTIQKMGKF
jgi:hypothetical protein